MADQVSSWFVPQNLLDMVDPKTAQAASDQARNTFIAGLLSGDIGGAFNTAQNQGYNVLSHSNLLQEATRKAEEKRLTDKVIADSMGVAPGTGYNLPADQAGPQVPPVYRFNPQALQNNPMALYGDQARIKSILENFGPKPMTVGNRIVDANNPANLNRDYAKIGENMGVIGTDKYGNPIVAPLAGAVNATGQFESAKAYATEGAKAANDIQNITLPNGQTVGITRAQMVQAANKNQPFTTGLSPTAQQENTQYGQYLIKNVLEPAKLQSDAALNSNRSLAVMQATLEKTPLNQITNNENVQKFAGYAKAAGMLTPETAASISNLSSLRGLMSGVVLQDQLAQKGVQSTSDAQRMEQTISGMGDKEATQFLIAAKKAQNAVNVEYYKHLDSYRAKNGTLDGADAAWYNGKGKESIFRNPDMKKYAKVYLMDDGKMYRVFGDGGDPEEVKK